MNSRIINVFEIGEKGKGRLSFGEVREAISF